MNRNHQLRMVALCLTLLMAIPFPAIAQAGDVSIIHRLAADDTRPVLGNENLLEVHFINVACADSILLRMGEHTMLVDSGDRRTSERITQYLASIGVTSLEYAFATHPHDDHIGGFLDVLQEVPVGVFLQPRLFERFESDEASQLGVLLAQQGILVHWAENKTIMPFGEATLTFLQWQNPDAAQNNRSMIVKVQLGERTLLLSADIEGNAQKALAAEYGDALRADILKMPHHGLAAYQSEFHEAVQPSLATFSNVKDSIYTVIRSVERRNIDWMLTTKGTIVAVTEGDVWTVWQIKNNN